MDGGEFVAIIGKSGSGKSTLINMVTGIDRPSTGEVIVGGTPVHTLSEGQVSVWRGRNLGIIFQFFQLLPSLSVVENVMLPMDFCHMYKPSERHERAMMLLEQVEMAEQANKLPSAISGGQQQRVAIARAMANDPPILIADEPTGNLDSKTATAVFKLFEDFVGRGKTIVMVTHDNDLARRASRSVIVSDGEIVNQYLAHALPKLSLDQLITVTRQLDRLTFQPGQPIVHKGGSPDYFYIVTKGKVEVIIDQPGGGELIAEHLGEGDYFDAMVQVIRRMPGVADAQAARSVTVRAQTPNGEWKDLQLLVIGKVEDLHMYVPTPLSGEWPPSHRTVVLERAALPFLGAVEGQPLHIELSDGTQLTLPVSGTVYNLGSGFPTALANIGYGYISDDSAELLGAPAGYNSVDILVAGNRSDEDHIRAVAEARLAQLTGAERQGNLASAQAGVSAAEAKLAEVQSGPTDATLAAQAARVRGAEVSLKQAQLALEKATLSAPIDGTVAELNLKVGELPATESAAIVVADLSSWELETEDLTELSVVRVRQGDTVTITFDAIPGFELPGTVAEIKPLGQNRQGDIVYTVVVKPTSWDERLLWNMTASIRIDSTVASN